MTEADPFRCICPLDPTDLVNGYPRAVKGCPAHRARYAAQRAALFDEQISRGVSGCSGCAELRKQALYWRDQQDLAAHIAADLADLNDHDGQVALLRRQKAEREIDVLTYRLEQRAGSSRLTSGDTPDDH